MPKVIDRPALESALVAAVRALGAPTAVEVWERIHPMVTEIPVRRALKDLARRGVLRARVGHREWPRQYGPTVVTSPVVYEVVPASPIVSGGTTD